MTSDNLLKFLGNREYLHQVSYQELKSMVVQYPYSLSLRYLLAMKSQQEDNTDLDRNIELLSTYGIDRSHLHRIFSEDPIVLEDLEESIIMGEDFLELKELSSFERDLDEKLAVNEVNDLNFLAEENQLAAKEMPLPNPSTNLPIPPPIPNIPEAEEIGIAPSLEKEVVVESNSSDLPKTGKIEMPTISEKAINPDMPIKEEVIIPETTKKLEEVGNLPSSDTPSILESNVPNPAEVNEIETPIIPIEKEVSIPETMNELEEEEEEFITLDFEDAIIAEMSEETADETAPSAALITNDVIVDGLPADAIEVTDLSPSDINQSIINDDLVKELFDEAEAEAIAEPAISDSAIFIENPTAILVAESELVESATTKKEIEASADLSPKETLKTPIESEAITSPPPIPFEVEFTEADPVTIASIQEGTEVVLPEKEENILQETILKDVQEMPQSTTEVVPEEIEETLKENIETIPEAAPIISEVSVNKRDEEEEVVVIDKRPAEIKVIEPPEKIEQEKEVTKASFKFDSLDQLEASYNQSTKVIKPAPKTKFNSWQEKSASVGKFSGANLMPLSNGTGRTIKRKRKAARKQFAKTVAFAEESLSIDNAVVSETLAQLLVKQGQYSKAREMYQQLCLIMPKKSSFFAGEIEKIQNLPDEDS